MQLRDALAMGVKTWSICFDDSSRLCTGHHQVVASRALSSRQIIRGKVVAFGKATTIWTMNR